MPSPQTYIWSFLYCITNYHSFQYRVLFCQYDLFNQQKNTPPTLWQGAKLLLLAILGFFHKFLPHDDAHNRSHHQASRPTAGVAQAVQALDAGVEVLVHLDPIGVEFQLWRI